MDHRRVLVLLAVVAAAVTACGPRVVRPPRVSSAQAAEIVVIRPRDDGGLAVQLLVDDAKVATTKSGESVTVRVDPGPHALVARVYRFPSFFSKGIHRFDAVAGRTHWFTVTAGSFNMPPYLIPLDAESGRRQAGESTAIPVGD
jgi:hypothetical protein